jgi:hypothetical protein
MKTNRKLGIYMDHSMANFIEYNLELTDIKTINLDLNHQDKEAVLLKGEVHLHNKEQHKQHQFYNTIKAEILKFNTILLFGSTTAKNELFNILSDDNHFTNIKVHIENTDKMDNTHQLKFVNDYFSKAIL